MAVSTAGGCISVSAHQHHYQTAALPSHKARDLWGTTANLPEHGIVQMLNKIKQIIIFLLCKSKCFLLARTKMPTDPPHSVCRRSWSDNIMNVSLLTRDAADNHEVLCSSLQQSMGQISGVSSFYYNFYYGQMQRCCLFPWLKLKPIFAWFMLLFSCLMPESRSAPAAGFARWGKKRIFLVGNNLRCLLLP